MTDLSRAFTARYPGRCNTCEERIKEGDQVRFSMDLIVHADCSDVTPERPAPDPCSRCFIVPSLSGKCDCDE